MKSGAPLALLLCANVVWAQANAGPPQGRLEHGRDFLGLAPPADPVAAARGQKTYAHDCSFCHGANATGAEGPDLVRSALVLHDDKGETIGPFLLKGRPEKGMPAFASLSEAETHDIAEFLHARVEAAANRWGYKVQNVVTGNPKAGEAYFNGAGACKSCHSASGDLAHIGKLDPADLQALFLYPDKNAAKIPVTVTIAAGESITGTLKQLDDFDISLYDKGGAYHSWPRDAVKIDIKDALAPHRDLLAKYTDADMHNLLAYLVTLK